MTYRRNAKIVLKKKYNIFNLYIIYNYRILQMHNRMADSHVPVLYWAIPKPWLIYPNHTKYTSLLGMNSTVTIPKIIHGSVSYFPTIPL